VAFASNNGVRLHWRWDGVADAPPLVLLNSIGTDIALWDRALPYLTTRYRTLRIDTRGHGASDAPPGDYTLDLLASDVLAVMDAAGVQKAAVCGVSLGGMVAMALALKAPDRVNALIPTCTSASLDPAAFAARAKLTREQGIAAAADVAIPRFFSETFISTSPAIVDSVRTAMVAMSAAGYASCCMAISTMDLLSHLAKITAPTLVIAGNQDIATPFKGHGDAIVARIPGAQAAHINGAHLPCLENPSGFATALISFLDTLQDGGAVTRAKETIYDAGLAMRRKVLGDAWVDKSLANRTPFNADFQTMITRIAWNEIWTRPGLDQRTRRLLVIAMTASLGRWEEFRLHLRAGLQQGGFTRDELKEVLMQIAIYAGVPAANTAFTDAAEIMSELDKETG
jgi:3-oxoadipate enol-lactonase/4-carboxymuconolactone decarboxylase